MILYTTVYFSEMIVMKFVTSFFTLFLRHHKEIDVMRAKDISKCGRRRSMSKKAHFVYYDKSYFPHVLDTSSIQRKYDTVP